MAKTKKKEQDKANFGVQKQQLNRLTKSQYLALKELVHLNKNMYNVALYNIRQHYFTMSKYLSYESNYHLCKGNENYRALNKNSAQQTIKQVHEDFSSFFALTNLKKQGLYNKKVKMPNYLDKDGFFTLIFSEFSIKNNKFNVPMSPEFRKKYNNITINVPRNLKDKTIKEVRIKPKYNARFFEVQWVYELPLTQEKINNKRVLAIDLGVNNLITAVTNYGDAFIIDGKALKSLNRYANKENSRLQSVKDLQKNKVETTKKQAILWNKRNNQVNDYINKAVHKVINHCINNNINSIVLGYNKDIQNGINIGRTNNQNFVNIPIAQIREKLSYSCKRCGINFIEQEESYTSKADFLSNDLIPTYGDTTNITYIFSGERIKRGLYKSATGVILNSDINGALNILKKANVCDISLTCNAYLSPNRIIIAKLKNKKKNKKKNKCTLKANLRLTA